MKRFFYLMMVAFVWTACQTTESAQTETIEDATAEAVVEVEKMTFPEDSLSADGNKSFHGLRIDAMNAMPVADLQAAVTETGSMDIKIAGPVEAACQAKGCWMTMPLADGTNMRVRFKDYGFFVPKDSKGKTAIVEGRAYTDTTSVDDLRHYAVDGGMSEEEAAAKYNEPKIEIAFEATGVIIENGGE
ncbi:MAG: DUF4920 domain-containing protein [Bacteroidia bacterium]